METIFISGKFSQPGARDIDVLCQKIHEGPSPHAITMNSVTAVIGGQPVDLDTALAEEMQKNPGLVFTESLRIVLIQFCQEV